MITPLYAMVRNRHSELFRIAFLFFLAMLTALLFRSPAFGLQPDCPAASIKLGMSTALSGPAAHLGVNMRTGVDVALEDSNATGGVNGRRFCLIAKDDGYEPALTLPNMLELIEQEKVLAIIGNVGTPTAIAAVPVANRIGVPFIGAFSGAGVLRQNPPDRFVVNYRASYQEETAVMVEALINKGGLSPSEIAFFTQRDAYGDAGFAGGIAALKKHGLIRESQIVHGRYERNTLAVENGLASIMMATPAPKAVIMVAAYAPCAKFIRLARQYGLKSIFLNVSFVGAVPLASELGAEGEGVIITEVVPHFNANLPVCRDFRKAMRRCAPASELTFGALEGFIVTRMFLKAVKDIGGELTRVSLINALENLGQFDLGLGRPLRLGPDEHQASHQVWPTIIHKGKVIVFDWDHLPNLLR